MQQFWHSTHVLNFPNRDSLITLNSEDEPVENEDMPMSEDFYFQYENQKIYANVAVRNGTLQECQILVHETDVDLARVFDNIDFLKVTLKLKVDKKMITTLKDLPCKDGKIYHVVPEREALSLDSKHYAMEVLASRPQDGLFLFYTPDSVYPYALARTTGQKVTRYFFHEEEMTEEHVGALSAFCQKKQLGMSKSVLEHFGLAQDIEKRVFFTDCLPENTLFDRIVFTKDPITVPWRLDAKQVVFKDVNLKKFPAFMETTESLNLKGVKGLVSISTEMPGLKEIVLEDMPDLIHITPSVWVGIKTRKIQAKFVNCPQLREPETPKSLTLANPKVKTPEK